MRHLCDKFYWNVTIFIIQYPIVRFSTLACVQSAYMQFYTSRLAHYVFKYYMKFLKNK